MTRVKTKIRAIAGAGNITRVGFEVKKQKNSQKKVPKNYCFW